MVELVRSLWHDALIETGSPWVISMPPSFARKSASPACKAFIRRMELCQVRIPVRT